MSNVDLQQLVLGMCEDSDIMRGRVIKCLNALDNTQDDGSRKEAPGATAAAAKDRAWQKARLAEHSQQLQRGLACIKDAELALQPALNAVMRVSGTTASAQVSSSQSKSSIQAPAAHQAASTSQYPVPPPATRRPLPPMTHGIPPGTISTIPGIVGQSAQVLCKNCNKSYHVAANNPNACRYHSGKLQLDPKADVWIKKNVKNPANTPEFHWLFPGGFKYDCCGQDLVDRPGRVNGCAISGHIPMFSGNMSNI
ncbi:hypothetical protein GGR53DRAFT_467592 [Hypoxylon sp. FL1150]|nr:hypothetical protein GGR53DRAFT_467592 [Hypoxylon sp. FL1150]